MEIGKRFKHDILCLAATMALTLSLCPAVALAVESADAAYLGDGEDILLPTEENEGWMPDGRYVYSDGTRPSDTWAEIEGVWYHFDEKGYRQSGWIRASEDLNGNSTPGNDGKGCWYKLDVSGELIKGGWAMDSQGWCYLDPETGAMWFDSWARDSKAPCYIGHSGYCETGWFRATSNLDGMVTNGADGKGGWYYADESGCLLTDIWVKDSKGWCYLAPRTGEMRYESWAKDSKGWCYLGHEGYCMTGWFRASADCKGNETPGSDGLGAWYCADKSGVLQQGCWYKDSKGWCYLNAETGEMYRDAWAKDSKGWCYVDDSGYCQIGWFRADVDFDGNETPGSDGKGAWYFTDGAGRLVTNKWVSDSEGWIWLDGTHGNAWWSSWKRDSSGWCYLADDVCCVTDATIVIENGRGEAGHPVDGTYAFDKAGHAKL